MSRQGGLRASCDANQRHPLAFEDRQDGRQFLAFAAVGDGNHQIDVFDHAQVAVAGFCWMHKHGWRSCGGQGGCDLASNVSAFAHAHHHHATAYGQDGAHRLHETRR